MMKSVFLVFFVLRHNDNASNFRILANHVTFSVRSLLSDKDFAFPLIITLKQPLTRHSTIIRAQWSRTPKASEVCHSYIDVSLDHVVFRSAKDKVSSWSRVPGFPDSRRRGIPIHTPCEYPTSTFTRTKPDGRSITHLPILTLTLSHEYCDYISNTGNWKRQYTPIPSLLALSLTPFEMRWSSTTLPPVHRGRQAMPVRSVTKRWPRPCRSS